MNSSAGAISAIKVSLKLLQSFFSLIEGDHLNIRSLLKAVSHYCEIFGYAIH